MESPDDRRLRLWASGAHWFARKHPLHPAGRSQRRSLAGQVSGRRCARSIAPAWTHLNGGRGARKVMARFYAEESKSTAWLPRRPRNVVTFRYQCVTGCH